MELKAQYFGDLVAEERVEILHISGLVDNI